MNKRTYERNYDVKDAKGFLTGVLLGGMVGAATMLLLAPQSGEATRAKLQQKGMELRDQTVEAVDTATAQVRVKTRQLKAGIHDKAEELQQYGQELLGGHGQPGSSVVEAAKSA